MQEPSQRQPLGVIRPNSEGLVTRLLCLRQPFLTNEYGGVALVSKSVTIIMSQCYPTGFICFADATCDPDASCFGGRNVGRLGVGLAWLP